jgi:dTDP-4-dehydrorhamnose reductase
MRIVVLGASGMLGHKLLQTLHPRFEVFATVRSDESMRTCLNALPGFPPSHFRSGVDALDFAAVRRTIAELQPQVIVNCIGVVKQSDVIHHAVSSIQLNALFPHQLAQLCGEQGIRLILFSTDCVFSGRRGHYSEQDIADPIDLYGRSKLLGEVDQAGCLTLRTSIVGWELEHQRSLLGWFGLQRGKRIRGYQRAIFSGLSTLEIARLTGDVIEQWPQLSGIFNVAGAPISKLDLLCGLKAALGWQDVDIQPDGEITCDRSLSGAQFQQATGWTAPPWSVMIAALAQERAGYERGALQG